MGKHTRQIRPPEVDSNKSTTSPKQQLQAMISLETSDQTSKAIPETSYHNYQSEEWHGTTHSKEPPKDQQPNVVIQVLDADFTEGIKKLVAQFKLPDLKEDKREHFHLVYKTE